MTAPCPLNPRLSSIMITTSQNTGHEAAAKAPHDSRMLYRNTTQSTTTRPGRSGPDDAKINSSTRLQVHVVAQCLALYLVAQCLDKCSNADACSSVLCCRAATHLPHVAEQWFCRKQQLCKSVANQNSNAVCRWRLAASTAGAHAAAA